MLALFQRVPRLRTQSRAAIVAALCGDVDLAVHRGRELLEAWPEPTSPLDRWLNQDSLARLRQQLEGNVIMWTARLGERDRLTHQLQVELEGLPRDPFDRVALLRIELLLSRAVQLGTTPALATLDEQGRAEGERRHAFRKHFERARAKMAAGEFKQAAKAIDRAEQLYAHPIVMETRMALVPHLEAEERYLSGVAEAQAKMAERHFRAASRILSVALQAFSRAEGRELLQEAEREARAQQVLLEALEAEQAGRQEEAIAAYESVNTQPLARIRRAILLFRRQRLEEALLCLEIARGNQAQYWRGFVAAQLGHPARALEEWHELEGDGVMLQRRQLESKARRDRLLSQRQLEELVEERNWEEALRHAEAHEARYGADSQVTYNVEHHLLPQRDLELWESQTGAQRLQAQKEAFFADPSASRLHNWFVCAYQQVLQDRTRLPELVPLWLMTVANLAHYPSPLRGLERPAVLRQLEMLVREDEVAQDRFRLASLVLELAGTPPRAGYFAGELLVLPGIHSEGPELAWRSGDPATSRLIEALYSAWGPAVAACLAGDLMRAVALKPAVARTEAERLAEALLAFKRGVVSLRTGDLKAAREYLGVAKAELASRPDWRAEAETAFRARQGTVTDVAEALTLSACWKDLLDTQEARAYWVELRARNVATQLGEERISEAAALIELGTLLKVDADHALALDIKRRIEEMQDMRAVFQHLEAGRFQEAVSRARQARHDSVRQTVAERLIMLAVDGLEQHRMNPMDAREIVVLAHQIKPHAPEFREVYRAFHVG